MGEGGLSGQGGRVSNSGVHCMWGYGSLEPLTKVTRLTFACASGGLRGR